MKRIKHIKRKKEVKKIIRVCDVRGHYISPMDYLNYSKVCPNCGDEILWNLIDLNHIYQCRKGEIMNEQIRYEKVDWDGVRKDVNEKISAIQKCWQESEQRLPEEVHRDLVKDVYLPAIKLLANFVCK